MTALVVIALFATASADTRGIVVLVPEKCSADDELMVADVARELQLGGFTVTRIGSTAVDDDGLRAELLHLAKEHGATGAIRLSPTRTQITVEVWGSEGEIYKLRRRDFPATKADARRVVALRSVELLRAVMLEVSLASLAPPAPKTEMPAFIVEPVSAPTPTTSIDESITHAPRSRNRVWRIGTGVAVEYFGNVAPTVSLSIGRLVAHRWLAEGAARTTVIAVRDSVENAKLEARHVDAIVGIGPLWRSSPSEFGLLASAGVSVIAARGDAALPLITAATTRVRPTVAASVRTTYWLNDHAWSRFSGQLGWIPPIDLYLGPIRATELGPLTASFELAFGWAWDS